MINLTRLRTEVQELKTAQESAKALISGLSQKIRENKDDQAALDALADELDASTNSLSQAVVENTPAADESTPTEPPTTEP